MATIANLAVSLTARIGNFEKGFKKATRVAKRFSSDLSKHVKTISKYAFAIASVALGGLSILVKGQLSAIDATSKLSRTLGLSTEELAGYQYAASLAGVESDALDKGITKMNRTVADAVDGLSTAKLALDKAGLSVKDLSGLSTDQRIKLLADRYNSIGDAATRASFLMNIFGRAGIGIGNLFEQGAEGIREAQLEAERLGLTFSNFDARGVEEANDALTRIKAVVTGIARRIAVQLAPFIQVISERFRDFALEANFGGESVVNAVNYMLRAFDKLLSMFNLLKAGWNVFVAAISDAAAIILQPARLIIQGWNEVLDFLGLEVDRNMEKFFDDLIDGFTNQTLDAIEGMDKAWANFNNGFGDNQATLWFQGIQADAAKASRAIESMTLPDVMDEELGESSSSRKAQEFQQVDLARVAIGGGRPTDKPINRAQGEAMVTSLQQIARNTASGRAVLT
jgi:hypothetical protein